jgi:hypothetical protein
MLSVYLLVSNWLAYNVGLQLGEVAAFQHKSSIGELNFG